MSRTTTLTLPTTNASLLSTGDPTVDNFDIDIGDGDTWTRIGTGVARREGTRGTPVVTYWDCPQRTLTDNQRVRVTMNGYSTGEIYEWSIAASTEPLGAYALPAAQWSFSRAVATQSDYDVYTSDTNIVITYDSTPELKLSLKDSRGRTITQLRLFGTDLQRYTGTEWVTLVENLTVGDIHDLFLDTHAWKLSVNGASSVPCEPNVIPIGPLDKIELVTKGATAGYFGQIRYE